MVKNLPVMQETWVPSLIWEDPLEKGKATLSSILAWRIPMDRGARLTTVCVMDCSLPGSSIHGIFRATVLEWGAIAFSPEDSAATAAKSLQSCPTLCDPMDCSLPGFSVHEIFQARVLEWHAIAFSDSLALDQVKFWTMG